MTTYDTWTKHRLTSPMLERLSAICKARPHGAGVSLKALEDRGLVQRISPKPSPEAWQQGRARTHEATTAGRLALEQARKEGW